MRLGLGLYIAAQGQRRTGLKEITFISEATTAPNTAASSFNVTTPPGTQAGDLLLIASISDATAYLNTPSGMTNIGYLNNGGYLMYVFAKKLAGVPAASTAVTASKNCDALFHAFCYRGGAAGYGTVATNTGNQSLNMTAPSVTASSAGIMLSLWAGWTSGNTFTSPSDMTQRANDGPISGSNLMLMSADKAVAAGSTGPETAAQIESRSYSALSVPLY